MSSRHWERKRSHTHTPFQRSILYRATAQDQPSHCPQARSGGEEALVSVASSASDRSAENTRTVRRRCISLYREAIFAPEKSQPTMQDLHNPSTPKQRVGDGSVAGQRYQRRESGKIAVSTSPRLLALPWGAGGRALPRTSLRITMAAWPGSPITVMSAPASENACGKRAAR
jgi:hypothetical protein